MSNRAWLVIGAGAALVAAAAAGVWRFRAQHSRWPGGKSWVEQEEEEQRRKYAHRILKMAALPDVCYDVRYSPDGNHLGLAIAGGVEIRDAKTLERVGKNSGNSSITSISFHPTKPWIACGTWRERGVVEIRKWPEGDLVKEIETDTDGVNYDGKPSLVGDDRVRGCAFSADGNFLVAATNLGAAGTIYETAGWSKAAEAKRENARIFTCFPFTQSSRMSCSFYDRIGTFAFADGHEQSAPDALLANAHEMTSMSDDETVCAFKADGKEKISVRNVKTGAEILRCSPTGSLRCVELSHGGQVVASGDEASYARFWRVDTGELLAAVRFGGYVRHIRFSKDDSEAIINLGTALVRFAN